MIIREVMNKSLETIQPDAPIVDAAKRMRDADIGVLPVVDEDRVVGMLTDRDITVRFVAEGRDAEATTVEDVMTADTVTCTESDDVKAVAQLMADRQIRRVAVLGADKKLVGIVSLGDLAIMDQDQAGEALGGISERRHDEPGAQVQH